MTAIELLEDRIIELEKKIYGSSTPLLDNPLPENSIVDNLLHTNTLISTTLSGQQKTTDLIKRLPELNELLDLSYDEEDEEESQINAKFEIIIATEDEMQKNVELSNKMIELMPALEIDKIEEIPKLTPKLEHLTVSYLQAYEESNEINNTLYEIVSKYNNIIDTISKLMLSLDVSITAAEIAAIPKKIVD